MLVRDVMTQGVEIVNPGMCLKDAASIMRNRDIGALPVGENDRLVGMVTDRDITIRGISEGKDPQKTSIRDVMSKGIAYCFDDDKIQEAGSKMKNEHIRRLVVLNHDKRAVGICSLGDIIVDSNDRQLGGDILKDVSQPVHH